MTSRCLPKRGATLLCQILGTDLVPESPGNVGLGCGHPGVRLAQEREASVTKNYQYRLMSPLGAILLSPA